MSLASRTPLSGPASFPVLVTRDGQLDRAAIRHQMATRWKGPAAWSASKVLAELFAKVRLQRKWALARLEENAAIKARIAEEDAALETEAQDIALRCGYDTGHLSFQESRYRFGSLADTNRAPQMRRLYGRALSIAIEHHSEPVAMAAE